jgi:hypothetical protein
LTSLEQPSSFQAAFFTLCAGEVFWAPDHGHLLQLDFGHLGIDPLQTKQERAGAVWKLLTRS